MHFLTLAKYFEKLEATSSRLSLIDILGELFAEIQRGEELKMVCYLLQSRVAPFYEATEIGMAEKNVASSIAKAFNIDRELVLKAYSTSGDLGETAGQFSKKHHHPYTNLSVEEVFNKLLEIAKFQGAGTVEKKVTSLASLLKKMSPTEAKHLVRIPLGISRLGIGDPTILDAFAKLKLGDKSKRKILENAYNRVSDLGFIGKTLWEKGLRGIEDLQVVVGRPLRSQLCERINSPGSILEKYQGSVHVQLKYDGIRIQIHKQGSVIKLFSRNLEETTHMFPDIIAGVKSQVRAHSIILDSEALAYNPASDEFLPFQQTTKRRRKHGVEEAAKTMPLRSFVFDIMYLSGKSLIDTPLTKRMELLKSAIKEGNTLIPNAGEVVTDVKKINIMFEDALTKGLEGLILKRPGSTYEAGARNFNWVKMKKHTGGELKDTIDCVILGYIFGRGKRAEFGAGALLVGVYDSKQDEFETVAKIGTGLTDEEWRQIHKRADKIKLSHKPARVNSLITPSVWVSPEIVVEILADEITRSPIHTAGKVGSGPGYALRFPRLVRFREADKVAEDATTAGELIQMYYQQGAKS